MNDLSVLTAEFGDLTPYSKPPAFWCSKVELGMPVIQSLKEATIRTIGRSAGGRDIVAIEYGEKEEIESTTDNLASALSAKVVPPDPTDIYPQSFYGKKRRRKPSLCIQGPLHGGELTGTVAALNLCKVIETGRDLRGREWPKLRELARGMRLTIIPWLNPDGTARDPLAHSVGASLELIQRVNQGVASDGKKYVYPASKGIFPIPPARTAFMGSYYNDAGVNLQYDFCMPERQPETLAWMKYYLAERPDCVFICHCNAGSLIGPPDTCLPVGFQHELSRVGGAVRQRLLRDGYDVGRVSWAGLPNFAKIVLNQMNAVYHVCGAFPVMCEFPYACAAWPNNTLDNMLDIGLIAFEEVFFYAHHDGLRPYELWSKVRKQLFKE